MNIMSKGFKDIYKCAAQMAKRTVGILGTEHLLYGLLYMSSTNDSSPAMRTFRDYTGMTARDVERFLRADGLVHSQVLVTKNTDTVIANASRLANGAGSNIVGVEHLIVALLVQQECSAFKILLKKGIDIRGLINQFCEVSYEEIVDMFNYNSFNMDMGQMDDQEKVHASRDNKLPKELETIGIDVTSQAEANKLDPVIGRSEEIERIIQILSRRTKNNPVLIGEPGVGKSAIIEGLAQAIVEGNVPSILADKRIFSLDLASLVSGTKYRGEFEEKFKKAIDMIKKNGNIIIFIDEIHTIVGMGSTDGNAMDAANIIKPMLARGELQTIGATTIDEYRKNIEKDAALERRFQPIIVDPPNIEDSIKILQGLRANYEAHHNVKISDIAIRAAVEMSDRYITDRFLPDKAIDLMDEASSRKRLEGYTAPSEIKQLEKELQKLQEVIDMCVSMEDFNKAESYKQEKTRLIEELDNAKGAWQKKNNDSNIIIGEEDIADVVSSITSIPVSKLTQTESEKLMNLEKLLSCRVIGQDEAVGAVSRAIRRARAGLADPNRPIGSFIFLGPTGVGKTELSKALANSMFGDDNLMIRIDMSEYMDKANTSKLIGSAPGYVGYDEGGQLTEKVRRKPYSVVLFDEIEKAHPDVFNMLLQILEDGRITDSHGRMVSFKNTVIIMTSNIGAGEIAKTSLGFGSLEASYDTVREKQMQALKSAMKPEFINRIDDIIIFRSLEKEDTIKIADVMISNLVSRLKSKDIELLITSEAKLYLVEKGFNREYGARPLRRTIQKLVEDILSEKMLKGEINAGNTIVVDERKNNLTFDIQR